MNRSVLSALIGVFIFGVWSAANIVRQNIIGYVFQSLMAIIVGIIAVLDWKEKK